MMMTQNVPNSATGGFFAWILWVTCLSLGQTGNVLAASDEDLTRNWVKQPWEYRYVIYIESPLDYGVGLEVGGKDIAGGKTNFSNIEPLFPLSIAIPTDPKQSNSKNQAIGAIVVSFDPKGYVITPNKLSLSLRGRLNRSDEIVLSAGDKSDSWQFQLGYWDTGSNRDEGAYEDYSTPICQGESSCLPDQMSFDGTSYTPAICDWLDITPKGGRYQKGYNAKLHYDLYGNFGCREWGYYLQSREFPYIDVTSYGKDKYGPFSYIRPILGWGRFDVPPKPVIGKHGHVWVCLHECPNGEAPGIIPDIKQWAARNGWPVPKRPKKQPMFPDREYKRGELID